MQSRETLPRPDEAAPSVRVLLFNANGKDREGDLDQVRATHLTEHELAWVDVQARNQDDVQDVFRQLSIDVPDIDALFQDDAEPLAIRGDWYAARAVAPCWNDRDGELVRGPWLLVVGPNMVVTAHKSPLAFLEHFNKHHDPDSRLGELDADSFAVVLLDRMLTDYFNSLNKFEDSLDRLEMDILADCIHDRHLPQLQHLRREAANFRRMLGTHRDLFDALRRPDFRPERDDRVDARFRAVADRYERAMAAGENARQLVVGSYELLETRMSQRTNDTIRLLTFVTVLLGGLAVVAGVLGMNFEARFFESGSIGFWSAVGAMAGIAAAALFVGWRRGFWK